MAKFTALRPKTYSRLTYDNDENKKAKDTTKCDKKRKIKYKDYKRYLEATQLENKINQLEINKFDMENLGEYHKEFLKTKSILKSQQNLEARNIMKKLTRLHSVVTMKKE